MDELTDKNALTSILLSGFGILRQWKPIKNTAQAQRACGRRWLNTLYQYSDRRLLRSKLD